MINRSPVNGAAQSLVGCGIAPVLGGTVHRVSLSQAKRRV